MRSARPGQRDLFDEAAQLTKLRPELPEQADAIAPGSPGGGSRRRVELQSKSNDPRRRGGQAMTKVKLGTSLAAPSFTFASQPATRCSTSTRT